MSEKISDTELIKLFNKNKLFDLFNFSNEYNLKIFLEILTYYKTILKLVLF